MQVERKNFLLTVGVDSNKVHNLEDSGVQFQYHTIIRGCESC